LEDNDFVLGFPATVIDTKHNFNTIRSLIDLKIGLGWDCLFCNEYLLVLQLAWEHREWIDHNEYQRFTGNTTGYLNNDANLSLYGLTLSAYLMF
jgi:hypothetical protein